MSYVGLGGVVCSAFVFEQNLLAAASEMLLFAPRIPRLEKRCCLFAWPPLTVLGLLLLRLRLLVTREVRRSKDSPAASSLRNKKKVAQVPNQQRKEDTTLIDADAG